MKYYPFFQFYGDRFSPNLVEQKSSIRFFKKNEPGEIGGKGAGRYINKPIPYGSAGLQIVESDETLQSAKELLRVVVNHVSLLRECGVEEIKFWLNSSFNPEEEQCNLELSPEDLKMLASLDAPLLVSVWAEGEDELKRKRTCVGALVGARKSDRAKTKI